MRLGIYLDGRNPDPWARPWPEFYRRQIDLVVDAEQRGLDSVWLSEHHGFVDGYLPQPLTLAAALAVRTDRIAIGTAVLLAPLWHPVRLAEEAALVDNLSGGRLALGLGAGYARSEFELYGADHGTRYGRTDEMVQRLRSLLGPESALTPPPTQTPPDIWLGYQGPQGARRAGRLGAPLLSLRADLAEPYRRALDDAGHGADSARMGGVVTMIVADDPDAAFERIVPHALHQLNTYREAAAHGTGNRPRPVTAEKLRARRHQHTGVMSALEVLTAEQAVAHLRRITDGLPVTDVFCWASIAGMPDDLVDRHIELLATRVRPAVAG